MKLTVFCKKSPGSLRFDKCRSKQEKDPLMRILRLSRNLIELELLPIYSDGVSPSSRC